MARFTAGTVLATLTSLSLGGFCIAHAEPPAAGQRQSPSGCDDEDRPPDQPAPGMHRMRVHVVDDKGAAVAGAAVASKVNRHKAATYHTDDDGEFLADIPTANFQSVAFHVHARGFMTGYGGGPNLPAELTIRLKPGVTIGGTVRNTEVQPIEGVRLTIWTTTPQGIINGFEAETDADGRWMTGIPPGEPLSQFRLFHREYICSTLWEPIPSLPSLRSETSVKVMKHGLTLRGVVRNQDGEPVGDALVLSQPDNVEMDAADDDPSTTRTTADGSFEFRNIPPGLGELAVYGRSLAPCVVPFDARPELPAVEVVLEPPGEISGLVIDEDGKPVAGATVLVWPWEWDAAFRLEHEVKIVTDGEGRFRLTGLPRQGTVTVRLSCGGFLEVDMEEVQAREEPYAFVLERPLVVEGQVVDARTGQPIRTYELHVGYKHADDDRPVYYKGWRRTSVESADGCFRWAEESQTLRKVAGCGTNENAPFALRAIARGYLPAETPLLRQGDRVAPIMLRLEPAEPVSGVVLTADGKAASKAEVAWVGPKRTAHIENGDYLPGISTSPEWIVETGDDGGFEFPASREAGLIVALHESGYATRSSNDHQNGVTLKLTPWARVEGVVQPGGRPLFEAYVALLPVDPSLRERDGPISWRFSEHSGEDGRFAFDHVPAIPLTAAWYASGPASHRTRLEPRPGETVHVEVGGPGGSVSGRIEAPDGLDLEVFSTEQTIGQHNIRLVAYPLEDADKEEEARANFLARLAPDGAFRFDGLPPGKYRLEIEIHAPVLPNGRALPVAVARGQTRFEVTGDAVGPVELGALKPVLLPGAHLGEAAPRLKGRTLAGEAFDLADLRGKPVLLYFWSSTSKSCKSAAPRLKELYGKYGRDGRVAFVGVALDWKPEYAFDYLRKREIPWPQFAASLPLNEPILEAFGVSLLPSYWLISADGTVLSRDAILDLLQPAIEQELARTQ